MAACVRSGSWVWITASMTPPIPDSALSRDTRVSDPFTLGVPRSSCLGTQQALVHHRPAFTCTGQDSNQLRLLVLIPRNPSEQGRRAPEL